MPILPLPSRPQTIFEVDDPSLDPEAITHALPPQDRLLPGALSVILCGSFVTGLALWPECLAPKRKDGDPPQTILHHMDVLLEASPFSISKPTPLIPGPAGGGDQGTGSRNPLPLQASAIPDAEPLVTRETVPEAFERAIDVLPIVPGGDGRSKGSGPGSGGGLGGGRGWGDGRQVSPEHPKFDYQLIPVTRITPSFALQPGQTAIATIVIVRITIEEDGRVSSAKALKGPEYLWSNAENNALCWTFEPLAKHGLKAPQTTQITFHYTPTSFKR